MDRSLPGEQNRDDGGKKENMKFKKCMKRRHSKWCFITFKILWLYFWVPKT